ncbi:MAG: arsenate reductase ArsC [Deferribacteres bacterium]|nr:arsenate reductase ArsC [candidate division KSB1 bacterium]MCB9503570.1 arsenate reductase ArsC [Deferribacteres bacterium]
MEKEKVLFICTHNSARSQMAEGLLRFLASDRFDVYSAGTESTFVKPFAIEAMQKKGIDIRNQTSDVIDKYMEMDFDYVITVCDHARETCPYFPTTHQQLHWGFEDPSDAKGDDAFVLSEFCRVRDLIEDKIRSYFQIG